MSRSTLFISDTILKERSSVYGNLDVKLIAGDMKAAQDMYIMPLLGTALYNRLQDGIADSTLTQAETELLDVYIIDCLMNYTLMEMPWGISYHFTNKGVVRKQSDVSDAPSMSELIDISNKYKNRAEHYAKRLSDYLSDNATTSLFPEYLSPGSGRATVHPSKNTFTIPIPLDDDNCGCDWGKFYS